MKVKTTHFFVFLLLGSFILLHLFLLSKTFLFDDAGNMRTAVAGYGDIPFHLTQITKFAFGNAFDFQETIFSGERLRYPFLINLASGLLLKLTNSWSFAVHLPVMLLAGANIILVYLVYKTFLKKAWAAMLALPLFFLGAAQSAYEWGAAYPAQNIVWGAPLTMSFLHQRTFFLGFFLFLLVLYVLLKIKDAQSKKLLALAAIAFGLLPLAHTHTFVATGAVIGLFFLISLLKKNKILAKRYFAVLVLGMLIAAPQIFYLVLESNIPSFLQLRLGWMTQPSIGSVQYPGGSSPASLFEGFIIYATFLWTNFGILLPVALLSLAAIFLFPKLRFRFPYAVFFASVAIFLFLLVQLVQFQPWDFDSNKILIYSQFFVAPLIIAFFLWLAKKTKARIASYALLFVFFAGAVYPGIKDVIPRLSVAQQEIPVIFDADARKLAEFVQKNIREEQVILTTSTHLNPINSLAGKPVLVGYPGWLWTRGIDYSQRENEIKNFYQNPTKQNPVLNTYNIQYILLSPFAMHDWKANKELFDKEFQAVYEGEKYTLYEID